ncbi:hypothetical protein [Kocuria tytonis]|uniref:Uncharacterized protein n=1 Tax=Kocuria tytonis TaxID=2054280 RepID=A0A495AAE8_9MICC|nr:hypothetical protein [Kocuria tytonis]RKQ36410.1 hypothetical protein C1C97_001675 [Kocuria tytonis]
MTAISPGAIPPSVRIPVLATYTDENGHQLPLPQARMRESFTGLQMLARQILSGAEDPLDGYDQDFTIMQMGPSAFEIEIRATAKRQNRLRGRAAAKKHLLIVATLDHFTDVLVAMGELACHIANHPDTEVRFVASCYGDYYEFLERGRVVKAMEAGAVELLVTPESVEILRVILANLKQPGVAYATLTKRIPGMAHMRRTVVGSTQHLRDFADGGPFHLTPEMLATARSRVDTHRTEQWVQLPTSKNSHALWDEL